MSNGWGEQSDASKMKTAAERAKKQGATPERARSAGADAVNSRILDKVHPRPEPPAGDNAPSPNRVRLDDRSHAELALAAKEHGIADADTLSKDQLVTALRGLESPDKR